MMFERVESAGRPGAFKTLSDKARQLTGDPNSPLPPAGRNIYGALVSGGQADIFITYCTNAKLAAAEVPTLQVVEVPARINVNADYGLTRTLDAVPLAVDFMNFLLGGEGQSILARHGFSPA